MKIDGHQHFWRYRPETHAWIDDSMQVLRHDFLPPDLEPMLRASGFDGCVAVQAAQTLGETRFLLELAAAHPFILGVVGWVDLKSADVAQTLQQFAGNPRFKGVRHIAQSEPDDFLFDPAFRRGVASLAGFGLSYDVLIYTRQFPAAVDLVESLPNVRFVLDHLGKPDIRGGALEPWRTALARMARSPNVYCKLSGLVTEADWRAWRPANLLPFIDAAVESFGTNRLFLGSDWPVCLLAASYAEVSAVVDDYFKPFSAAERAAVFRENAIQAYRLSV